MMPRVNINITDDMKKYFENLSKETGASQSALMALYLKEYMEQKESFKSLPLLLEKMNMFEK